MRDITFKNLTSFDRRRKIIVSKENYEQSGIRTQITRHLICLIKKVEPPGKIEQPSPYLYVLKERNHQKQIERFVFRLKGSIYAVSGSNLYLIKFLHSLKIRMKILNPQPLDTEI